MRVASLRFTVFGIGDSLLHQAFGVGETLGVGEDLGDEKHVNHLGGRRWWSAVATDNVKTFGQHHTNSPAAASPDLGANSRRTSRGGSS